MAEILPNGSTLQDVRELFEPLERSDVPEVAQAATDIITNLEYVNATPGMDLEPQVCAIYRRQYRELMTLVNERLQS